MIRRMSRQSLIAENVLELFEMWYYLRQGCYVFIVVCLAVSRIAQNLKRISIKLGVARIMENLLNSEPHPSLGADPRTYFQFRSHCETQHVALTEDWAQQCPTF